jgi:hypothetical protein
MNRCYLGGKMGILYSKTGELGCVHSCLAYTQTTSYDGADGILGRGQELGQHLDVG